MDVDKPDQGTPPAEPATPPAEPPADPKQDPPVEPATPPEEKPKEVAKEPVEEKKPEVPGETPPEEPKTFEVDGEKLTEEELKAGYMRQKDYTQKTQEVSDLSKRFKKVEEAFKPEGQDPPAEPPKAMTQDEVEKMLEDRDKRTAQELALKSEIKTLEKEFTGEDGRPKYDDKAVLKWQRENSKMYLSPREAFKSMNEAELLEWEVKNRVKKAGKETFQEKPGAGSEIKFPAEKKAFLKADGTDDSQARVAAIMETIDNMESEV